MYKIKYNDAVICTPQFKEFAAIAGTLQEGLNAVSVFSFTLPPNHLYLDSMEGRNGLVKLYDDDNVLFIGDIVNRKENFDCTTEIECQNALGWLNDVVFVKPTFNGAIENYWAYLLGRYNQEASEWRKINIGTVTVQGNISINHDTEFLTIFDLVSELTKLSGGYVSVRYEGEEIFLDYLAQANTESDQSILFGTNLINLEDFVSEEQIFSRIYPRLCPFKWKNSKKLLTFLVKSVKVGTSHRKEAKRCHSDLEPADIFTITFSPRVMVVCAALETGVIVLMNLVY